ERIITLATEQGFPFWLAQGTMVRGWALVEQGQVKDGIAQVRQGLTAYRAMGHELGRPSWLAHLAWAYGKEGQAEEGLSILAEALASVDKTGERIHEAGLYWLKGELTLKQSPVPGPKSKVVAEAEACFHKALDIARKQQAKSLELRAAMSLSRL